jgi:hypothetical protein
MRFTASVMSIGVFLTIWYRPNKKLTMFFWGDGQERVPLQVSRICMYDLPLCVLSWSYLLK